MPGHVFDALEEAATYLEARALSDAITAATFQSLVNNAYGDEPSYGALMHLEEIRDRLDAATSGKTAAEREWEQFESFKRMPGVRVIPKGGVGNG